MISVKLTREGKRIFFDFSFNRDLMAEIKMMDGAKYHGYDEHRPRKVWSVHDNHRNRFQISFLAYPKLGDPNNPYTPYDGPLANFVPNRKLYGHQFDLAQEAFTRHYYIMAAEMGTGKTLAAIEVMEASGFTDWIWAGPKSALVSVQLEFRKWKAKIIPRFVTYEGLKKIVETWPAGKKAPQGLIGDESSRLKNPTAQRTQAFRHIADSIRDEWGRNGFVIEMSGSPAPKSPADWYSQLEIAQPGFIREGTLEKFKKRLAIIESRESFEGGGVYPHLVAWRDDERKCDVCGQLAEAESHLLPDGVNVFEENSPCHPFKSSVNEVALLYKRMKGLVGVKFKKDCLDLPDKVYKEIVLKPTRSVLNAAMSIQAKARSAVEALTNLRELSDGFQYVETAQGTMPCPNCKGTKTEEERYDVNDPDNMPDSEEFEKGHRITYSGDFGAEIQRGPEITIGTRTVACNYCSGVGEVSKVIRTAHQIPSPKEAALRDILDEHDEIGRLVVYGGFTGSIDRVIAVVKSAGWDWIRVDGRGWSSSLSGDAQALLGFFQNDINVFPRICFVGQPGAAGMGLTLTASPTIVYYSNDFNAESRIQSEDRIHRAGMDTARGATIVDLLHLPSDKKVLDNLKKKRRLQAVSMGEIAAMMAAEADEERKV